MNPAPTRVAEDWPEAPVLVAFSGDTDLWYLRWLRPGFRHCFAVLRVEDRWLVYNPLSHGTQISLFPPAGMETLVAWLRRQGYTVVTSHTRRPPPRPAPWRPYTCVEAVKRLLGLQAPRIFTPWQLYRYIGSPAGEYLFSPLLVIFSLTFGPGWCRVILT